MHSQFVVACELLCCGALQRSSLIARCTLIRDSDPLCPLNVQDHGLPGVCSSAGGVGGAASSLPPVPDDRTVLQLRAHQGKECSLWEDSETGEGPLLWTHKTFAEVSRMDGSLGLLFYVFVKQILTQGDTSLSKRKM